MAITHESATAAEADPDLPKEILLRKDAFARLADADRMLGKVREGEWEPNISALARRAGMSKQNLAKFASGDQGLTKKIIEVVIEASGMDWLDALAEFFVYDTPRSVSAEGAREQDLAAAA